MKLFGFIFWSIHSYEKFFINLTLLGAKFRQINRFFLQGMRGAWLFLYLNELSRCFDDISCLPMKKDFMTVLASDVLFSEVVGLDFNRME